VIINPNNPTGAVYSKELLMEIVEIARQHNLIIFADEIYDKILYDEAQHHSIAALAPDLLTVTFNGLSKTYRVAGFRQGWMVLNGPKNTRKAISKGWRCWPLCVCAPTCRRSTRSRPRWAAIRASANLSFPAAPV
jgi:alanine-synthesizing transaminase